MISSIFKSIPMPWRKWLGRLLFYGTALSLIGLGGVVAALRWWILPEVTNYRADIEAQISRASGHRVTIGAIGASWDGLRPYLALGHVVIHDKQGQPALTLEDVGATLSWMSLPALELRLHQLEIVRPQLLIQREADGTIYVSGIKIDPNTPSNFADWVLRQDAIRVSYATVEWRDQLRNAPPLLLRDVGMAMKTSGRHHRFGVIASAPEALASTLDIRGDLKGVSLGRLQEWKGELYANLGQTDIAAWRTWIDLPYAISQGQGAVQAWSEITDGRVTGISAQLRLTDVRARLGKKLPELALARLGGRLGWRELARGFEFTARGVQVDAQRRLDFSNANVLVRYQAAQGREAESGKIEVDNLQLEPLIALMDYLPLSDTQRAEVNDLAPRGRFQTLRASWEGPYQSPAKYDVTAEFANVGLKPYGRIPGFDNVSGTLQADQHAGRVRLTGAKSELALPKVMRHPIPLAKLQASARWRVKPGEVELTIENASFENDDLAGQASGVYRSMATSAGYADINASLQRANGVVMYRYLPILLGDATYDWLKASILQGTGEDVHLKLKGPLAQFPFENDKQGVFQVTARTKGVTLKYAPDWPALEGVEAALDFHSKRMDIVSSKATISGVQLPRVKVSIPDMTIFDEILEINGEAQGPTNDFLRFMNTSPVAQRIDHFTDDMQADGNGKLALSIRLPLRRVADTTVAGTYQFVGNRIKQSADSPPVQQASGSLSFNEKALTGMKMTGQFLGSPMLLSAKTVSSGLVRVTASGKITSAALQAAYPGTWASRLQGETPWSASVALGQNRANAVFVSNLTGMAMNLPAPFAKTASASLPLKMERLASDGGRDSITFSLGTVMAGQIEREQVGDKTRITRGVVNVGTPSPALAAAGSGLRVNVKVPSINLDEWLQLGGAASEGGVGLGELGLQVNADTVDVYGHTLHGLKLNGQLQPTGWRATLDAAEVDAAEISQSGENGKIVVRARRLQLGSAPEHSASTADFSDADIPAIDIAIDNFEFKQSKLGKLELVGVKKQNSLQLERLKVTSPHGSLNATGVLLNLTGQPQTKINVDVDVQDIGKFLGTVGHADEVKGGTAKLTGSLVWRGSLVRFNLPTLAGDMHLEARRGQFLKVQPGVGRLLGLVSLQSLPRRLSLDFRDVFSDGFAFDTIDSTMTMNSGVLSTKDFSMVGPSATVNMNGTVNVVNETQNLNVKVVPGVGDSVAVATAFLGGPAVGAAALVLQRILKDPVGQIISYDYKVTGTWVDPVVTKVSFGQKPEATP